MPFKSWYPVLENTRAISEAEIQISIDKDKKTLSTDNGIGMTAEEVKIPQVAFSSAEEFIQKYQGKSDQPIIGHFTRLLLSFMVAQKVEIDTLSYKEGSELFIGDGSPEFRLEDSPRKSAPPSPYPLQEEQEY